MRRNTIVIILASMLALGVSSCNKRKSSATEGSFTMICDESFENIMRLEVDLFHFDYPHVDVLDRYAPYSEVVDSLMSLNTSTVVLPRDVTAKERAILRDKKRTVRSQRIAVDAVALIVNPDNPVNFLTMEEVKDIFDGKVRTWYELHPSLPDDTIRILFPTAGSSMVKYMRDSLLNGAPLGPNSYAQGSVQGVLDGVRKRKDAIGVIGVSWLTSDLNSLNVPNASDSLYSQIKNDIANGTGADGGEINTRTEGAGVKVLGVRRPANKPYTDKRFLGEYDEFRAYKPYQEEIYKGFYPLTRSIFLITTAYSNSPAGGFFSFVTGDVGQRLLQRTGVMPAVFRTQVVELVN